MKSALRKTITTAAVSAVMACSASIAQATTWNIVDVLGGEGNFGASLFHTAGGTNPMSGSTILNFTSWNVSGTYDDMSGVIDATFTNPGDATESFTLKSVAGPTGDFDFTGPGGRLASNASLNVDFSPGLTSSSLFDDIITFLGDFVCCGSTAGDDPNSFSTTSGIIALWGATNYNPTTYVYGYSTDRFGLDLRLQLTPVPIPAALPLFAGALGLMGFLGWRRRRTSTS